MIGFTDFTYLVTILKALHLDGAKYKPAPFFYNYKGDRTRNPEQMFENWKLGFPIGSRNLPKQTAINELSKSV